MNLTDNSVINKVEEIITQCISSFLQINVTKTSADGNFFSLGIDSIKSIEIIENLGKKLNVSIYPTLIFEYPTITELSEYLVEKYQMKLQDGLLVNTIEIKNSERTLNINKDAESKSNSQAYQVNLKNNQRIIGEL